MSERKYPIRVGTVYFKINVKEMERAKKFYSDVFNLEIVFAPPPEVGWCELQLPGGAPKLGLNLLEEGEFKPGAGMLMMEVEDIEGNKAYLEGKGVETSDYTDIPGIVTYFYMKDSEGNSIQIVSEPRVKE
jgi:predicted enzyme related to lactoylglutathione lyase